MALVIEGGDAPHRVLIGGSHDCRARDVEVLESVAILTCPPRPPVDAIHDRMPLLIPR